MAAATQKKKSTAPARKSPPPERTPRPRGNPAARIAGGILCLLFALCTAVSYFGVEGLVLVWLRKILCGLLGYGYWLFGAALLCAGIALLLHLGSNLRFIQLQIFIRNKGLHITEHFSVCQCNFCFKENLVLLLLPFRNIHSQDLSRLLSLHSALSGNLLKDLAFHIFHIKNNLI